MTDTFDDETFKKRYGHLLGETAQIPWKSLQLFYAQGKLLKVEASLDLVEVATQVSLNDEATVGQWIESGHLNKVDDNDARHWFEQSTELWAVVVSPWVLVQNKPNQKK